MDTRGPVLHIKCKDGNTVLMEKAVWAHSSFFVNLVSDLPSVDDPIALEDHESAVVERFCAYLRARNARPPGTVADEWGVLEEDVAEFPLIVEGDAAQTEANCSAAVKLLLFAHTINSEVVMNVLVNRIASLVRSIPHETVPFN